MGLTRDGIALLVTAQRLGVEFTHTLMLGRQSLLADHARLGAAFADNSVQLSTADARRIIAVGAGYSEPLLRHHGATEIDSLDAAGYEASTIMHDLNDPLPRELRGRFSVVIDGGTLEHVFDYPRALGNAMEAVGSGGHFVAITPANGDVGHGFYQLSSELFYRALAPVNGIRMVCMLLKSVHWRSRWRVVPDPAAVGHRIVGAARGQHASI